MKKKCPDLQKIHIPKQNNWYKGYILRNTENILSNRNMLNKFVFYLLSYWLWHRCTCPFRIKEEGDTQKVLSFLNNPPILLGKGNLYPKDPPYFPFCAPPPTPHYFQFKTVGEKYIFYYDLKWHSTLSHSWSCCLLN